MGAHASNCRLSGLSIRRPAKTEAANGLYANGRHQCEVIIDVVKETRGPDDVWVNARLTDEERASVTVVGWSEHGNQMLPQGWSCDEGRNEFSLGLWQGGLSEELQCTEVAECRGDENHESISRYLRCDPDAPIGPARFLVRAVVGGEVYTSSLSRGEVVFDSSIEIHSVRPFALRVSDLEEYYDNQAFLAFIPSYIDVRVYYWTPPEGIRFVENNGFSSPLELSNNGDEFSCTLLYDLSNPRGESGKVGTLLDKNELGVPLDINEVHKNMALPPQYLPVRFDRKPTIMRAIRMHCALGFKAADNKGFWSLIDNFGSEHKFLLGISPPIYDNLVLKDPWENGPINLLLFKISLLSGGESTNALYANGRHQCKVQIEVIIQKEKEDGGWETVRLSQEERDSVTVTAFSADANAPLPPGWSCDRTKNMFDSGILSLEGDGVIEDLKGSNKRSLDQVELVDRYLRFGDGGGIAGQRFMAKIVLGGVTYTTNNVGERSSIYVTPKAPYILRVSDFESHVDRDAYADKYCDVDVYYWWPKASLHLRVNRGLDTPMPDPNQGFSFQSTYIKTFLDIGGRPYFKGGVLVGFDELNPRVRLADIFRGHPEEGSRLVRFDKVSTIMRAVRVRMVGTSPTSGDKKTIWRLWDNYGCEHAFRLVQADEGNVIILENA